MRLVWLSLGLLALGLGVIGIALPLLPTVPFVLLAAFCFTRSSERLHAWILAHPTFGPPIEDWRRSGAISRRGKVAGSIGIAAAFGLSLALGVAVKILLVQALALSMVAVFIWTRPAA